MGIVEMLREQAKIMAAVSGGGEYLDEAADEIERLEAMVDRSQQAVPSNSSDLLACASCGADPREFCRIRAWRRRETWEKNVASAKCLKCGHEVTVSTGLDPRVIRALWDVRAI